jgi:hypothetical protein
MNVTIDIVNKDFLVWMPNLFCEYTDTGNEGDLSDFYHVISVYYDPSSYDGGEMLKYAEDWDVVSYQESEEKVTLSAGLMVRVEI